MSDTTTRRRFAAGVAAVTATLAGCTGDGGDGGSDGGDGGGGGGSDASVTVAPGGELVFDPDSLEVAAGTTVTFTWDSSGHNIVVESQPDGGGWSGVDDLQDDGHTHSHTFETTGTYEYYCNPHRGSGMEATITVTDG